MELTSLRSKDAITKKKKKKVKKSVHLKLSEWKENNQRGVQERHKPLLQEERDSGVKQTKSSFTSLP